MESRAKLFGHSIHQMLIVFPLGLLAIDPLSVGVDEEAHVDAPSSLRVRRVAQP